MSARIHGTNCRCGCRGWNHRQVDLNREFAVGVYAVKRLFSGVVEALGQVADAMQSPRCDCERCRR